MGKDGMFLRLAGAAALAGAALRANAARPVIGIPWLVGERLYFAVDVLLMLGLVGLLGGLPRMRSWLGVAGFAGAIAGFALIRTGDRLLGPDAYQTGSAVLGLALAVTGAALLTGRWVSRGVGAAWIASLAVGLAGMALHWPMGFTAASLLFCLGFAVGGAALLVGAAAA